MELTNLQKLPAPLLAWYDENRRVLPWREWVSPYRTWVSEIMLQQTRVQAVLPYFQRFMEAAPDVAALAALPEERLLRLLQPRPESEKGRPDCDGGLRRRVSR